MLSLKNRKKGEGINVFHRNYINWNERYFLIKKIINKYAKGKTLDIGCGKMLYKRFFTNIDEYIGVDIHPPPDQEDVIEADAMNLSFKDNSFPVPSQAVCKFTCN